MVSSSGNAVVHCQTTLPHLNISDIPFYHCFYTGLILIYHCMSTVSFLLTAIHWCSDKIVNTAFTLHIHCITTGTSTAITLRKYSQEPLLPYLFSTIFPLLFLPGTYRSSMYPTQLPPAAELINVITEVYTCMWEVLNCSLW